MGILNVTPDSFSDGGKWFDHDLAVAHGLQLIAEGADVVDVGGESTRPGAGTVSETEELHRVLPVIEELAPRVRVSIDTRRAEVARAGVKAGATIVNDTSATLWPVAAAAGVGWVAMHMKGEPSHMQLNPSYDDVVAEVSEFLFTRAAQARAAGVTEMWLDPGIGFGKTVEHNLELLAHLEVLGSSGWPVAVGVSRKRFLGILTGTVELPTEVHDRFEASLAIAVWAMAHGANMVRVHDVAATVHAARIVGDARVVGR
jgi:dihydropteroate synthase